MYRADNSYDSANNPVKGTNPVNVDFAMHKAIVLEAIYADDSRNSTKVTTAPRVLYRVIVVGGGRDGQVFSHCEDMTSYGGVSNYSERVWKGTTTLLRADIANLLTNIEPIDKLNGDEVYIQFIGGDINFPVIIGGAKHPSNAHKSATKADGPRVVSRFNGIKEEITKDGEYTWSKSLGKYTPVPLPDVEGNSTIVVDQFAVLPGFQDAIEFKVDNELKLALKVEAVPSKPFLVDLDAKTDELSITSSLGTKVTLSGLSGDSFEVASFAGASFKLDGLSDSFSIKTTAGAEFELSGISGALVKNTVGDELSLKNGAVELKNLTGAHLSFNPAGLVKLGNNTGDVLQILGEAFTALASQTAVGFGAPTSTVATFAQLAVKLKLISG